MGYVTRTILHLDLDAFFCAVEELHRPELRGKPFAVGGRPQERGVVSSCSYAARGFGVRSGMPMARALRLCPGLIVVPPRHRLYGEVSAQVMERLRALTSLVEQISIDEAFLDISELREPPERSARRLQAGVGDELGLPCSIGIATNKLVAKIATEVGKKAAKGTGPPNALTIVPAGEEATFLAPLPAEMLWGVGPKTAAKLAALGLRTIGAIARWPEADLIRRFGEHGRDLARHARGMDDRPIVTEHEIKSISQETTFARDVRDDLALEQSLRALAIKVGRRLRRHHLAGRTIKLKLRWPDFTTLTRQITLADPTHRGPEIAAAASSLLAKARRPGQPVRLIGVGVSGLCPATRFARARGASREGVLPGSAARQLSLWEAGTEKSRRLEEAVKELRAKYGERVIRRAREKQS